MHNNIIGQREHYPVAQEMWNRLNIAYDGTLSSRLLVIILKFELHEGSQAYPGRVYLKVMSTIIRNPKLVGNNFIDD